MEGLLIEAVAREQLADRARRASAARLARAARRRRVRGHPVGRILAGSLAFWHPRG